MSDNRWRLTVDAKLCINSGLCIAAAPGRFVQRASGSEPVAEQVSPDEALLEAAEGCPVEAIRVLDAVRGTILAPDGL